MIYKCLAPRSLLPRRPWRGRSAIDAPSLLRRRRYCDELLQLLLRDGGDDDSCCGESLLQWHSVAADVRAFKSTVRSSTRTVDVFDVVDERWCRFGLFCAASRAVNVPGVGALLGLRSESCVRAKRLDFKGCVDARVCLDSHKTRTKSAITAVRGSTPPVGTPSI